MPLVPSFHMPNCIHRREEFAMHVSERCWCPFSSLLSVSWKSFFSDLCVVFSQAIKNMRDSTGDTRNAGVRCLRISPDGQALATGDRSGNIRFEVQKKTLFLICFRLGRRTSTRQHRLLLTHRPLTIKSRTHLKQRTVIRTPGPNLTDS